jgi:hypothetical protein
LPSSLRITWKGGLEAKAFSEREIGGEDDVLDFHAGRRIPIEPRGESHAGFALMEHEHGPCALALPEKSATFEDHVLRRARKLDRDAGGENPLELHACPFDRNDTVGFIIQADDRVGADIFRRVDQFTQNEFTPIVLVWGAIRGVPSGGGLDLADRIENAAALDDVG